MEINFHFIRIFLLLQIVLLLISNFPLYEYFMI